MTLFSCILPNYFLGLVILLANLIKNTKQHLLKTLHTHSIGRSVLDQDQRIDRLITFRYFGFQTTDLAELLRKAKDNECDPFHDLEKYKERVNTVVNACFLGSLALYESTYLLYGYKFRKKEFGFAWETYYDETHRALDMDSESAWYDFIIQGEYFRIKIEKEHPEVHYIMERPFHAMNKTVIELGSCRDG